jgi:hypothetical protein
MPYLGLAQESNVELRRRIIGKAVNGRHFIRNPYIPAPVLAIAVKDSTLPIREPGIAC